MKIFKLLLLTGMLWLMPKCLTAGEGVIRRGAPMLDTLLRSGISLRDNLLWNGAGAPNLGVEIPLGKHLSIGANGAFKPQPRFFLWDNDRNDNSKWKHLALVPELRYWPKEVYEGWFAGTDLVYTHYNTGDVKFPLGLYPDVKDHRIQGDYYGLGLFAGYSWWIGRHWRIEAEAGVALGYADYEKYDCDHCGTSYGPDSKIAPVPKLGLNIAYNFRPRRPRKSPVIIIPTTVDTVSVTEVEIPDFAPVIYLVRPDMGVAGELVETHPILRPSSEYRPYTPDRILRKEEGALYVHFEWDDTRLLYDFRDNGPILDQIMDITSKIMADSTSSVSHIQIVGLASVEGGARHNQDLSDGRAKALQQYIQERLDIPDSLFDTVGGGEAWTEFRDQVNDLLLEGSDILSEDQLRSVLDIIDSEPDPARRESRIKALQGGRVYKALHEDILQDQRNSGYLRIYFDYVPDRAAEKINEAIDLLEQYRNEEALDLLDEVREDPRAAQALGLALFRVGRETEALDVLGRVAASGDPAALDNYMKLKEIIKLKQQIINNH